MPTCHLQNQTSLFSYAFHKLFTQIIKAKPFEEADPRVLSWKMQTFLFSILQICAQAAMPSW